MYHALVSKKFIKLYRRKMDAAYDHIQYRARDRVKYREFSKSMGDKLIRSNKASLIGGHHD